MAVPNTFTNGTVADADEVNENFSYVDNLLVPVGTVLPWLKTFGLITSGTNTSLSANKLIDSSATFLSNGITTKKFLKLDSHLDATTNTRGPNTSLALVSTSTIGNSSTSPLLVDKVTIETICTASNGYTDAQVKIYYTDSTSVNSEVFRNGDDWQVNVWLPFTYINPNPAKPVWKVEFYLAKEGNDGDGSLKNKIIFFRNIVNISSVDSETQLTLDDDYFAASSVSYSIYKTETLSDNFVECNGQTLSDVDSVYNGAVIPNLNNSIYLKGSTTSSTESTFGGSGTTYANYTVVYIMRVK